MFSVVEKKGVLVPSFFIAAALLFALLISSIGGYVFWWAGISALLFLYILMPEKPFPFNKLFFCVLLFIAILIFSALVINPAMTPESIYFIAWFAISFIVFSRMPDELITLSFRLFIVVFVILSIWAWLQHLSGTGYLVPAGKRANTIFFTPNTFAAALNLALLPLVAVYINGSRNRWLLTVIIIMFGALLASQSRGGIIAFSGAFIFLIVVHKLINWSIARQQLKKIVVALCLIFIVFNMAQYFKINKSESDFMENITKTITRTKIGEEINSLNHRWMIYQAAWNLIKEKPIVGHGYNSFQYYWQRDQQAPYIGSGTRFVHNDYLQLWMETGIPGLLSLVIIIIMVYYYGLKNLAGNNKKNIQYWLVITSGLTAYFIHALVDFVIYPPVLLLIFGSYLGVTSQLISGVGPVGNRHQYVQELFIKLQLRPVVVRSLVCVSIILWLSQPAIAQLAFDQANQKVRSLDVPDALPLYEMARRFAPYEPEYYRYEASIWAQAAEVGHFRESAERADALFAQGAAVNPFKMSNLMSRALLHRDHADLLDNPVNMTTVLGWMDKVLSWRPHDTLVQAEYIRTLLMMGNTGPAEQKYKEWSRKYPDSIELKTLGNEYGLW